MEDQSVSVHSGFPNPATDFNIRSLDINKLVIKHPASTFLMRVEGHFAESAGIFKDDIIVVDKSLNPTEKDIIVFWDESAFSIRKFNKSRLDSPTWGVVVGLVRKYK